MNLHRWKPDQFQRFYDQFQHAFRRYFWHLEQVNFHWNMGESADSPTLTINFPSSSHCIIEGALWIINGWKFNNKVYLEVYNRATNPQTCSSYSPSLCIVMHLHSFLATNDHHIVEQHLNGHMLCKKVGATRMFVGEGWHIMNESWN